MERGQTPERHMQPRIPEACEMPVRLSPEGRAAMKSIEQMLEHISDQLRSIEAKLSKEE